MKLPFAIPLSLLALLPASAIARTMPPPPPHLEVVIELTSYGERPQDLVALLVPFLSSKLYYRDLHRLHDRAREAAIAFEHPSGDFVVTSGRYNCIAIAYYSVRPGKDAAGHVAIERSNAFEGALLDFIDGLPSPRPLLREVSLGSKVCVEVAQDSRSGPQAGYSPRRATE